MSISNSYPTQRPVFSFNADAGKLDSRLSYSRSSGGTYMSSEKALSSENLLLQSQDFDTSPWQNLNLATTGGLTGGQTAPDGTSTAWLLTGGVSTGSTQTPSVYMNSFGGTGAGMVQPNSQNTYVMHVKAGTATHAWVTVRGSSSNYVAAVLDFSNTSSLTTYQVGWTLDSYQLTALGNSWYRIAVTFTSNSVVNSGQVYVGPTDSNTMTTYFPQWAFNGETLYAWGGQLSSTNSKVYDSPTTTQISRSYSPLLKTASADEPRFEFAADGQSDAGSPRGLLIEQQSTNLQRYGSAFSNWSTRVGSSYTSSAAVAPNGLLDATLMTATSNYIYHYVNDPTISVTSGTTYTASVYVKDAGQRYLQLFGAGDEFGLSQYATFDLQTGSVDDNGLTASAQNVGNGWWRLQLTMTATASGSSRISIALMPSATASRNQSWTANDYSGALLFGFQFEEGSSASSLVDTGSQNSALTRASDSCSVAVSDFGLTSSQDVTMMVEGDYGDPTASSNTRFAVALGKNSQSYISLYNGAGESGSGYIRTNGPTEFYNASGITSGNFKAAISAKNNSVKYAADGTSFAEDTDAELPSYTSLKIGGQFNGTAMNGTISRVAVYGQALSSTELAALTSS